MPEKHRFLKMILPQRAFEAVKAGTKAWLIACPCGHKQDFWDAGGVRYKAVGEPRQFLLCPACHKGTWHKIRKKSQSELIELGGPSPHGTAIKKEGKGYQSLFIIGLLIVTLGSLLAVSLVYSNLEPTMTVSQNTLEINGLYGLKQNLNELTSLELKPFIPKIRHKVNGYSTFGYTKKGFYELEGMGIGNVFILSDKGPYLYLHKKEGFIIITFKDPKKTEALYQQIKAKLDGMPKDKSF